MKVFGIRLKVCITFLLVAVGTFIFWGYYEVHVERKPDIVSVLATKNKLFRTVPLKYTESIPQIQNSTLKILNIAKQINARGLPVLLALVNNAYLSFTYSWLCNTMYMGIHRQVLFITTDSYSRKRIKRDWPAVKVVAVLDLNDLSGAQEYSKAGYVRLMVRRTELILAMLQERVMMLLFEVDCLWFANPLPLCKKEAKGYDIVASAISDRPGMIAAGFLYMLPTNRMITFWKKLTERLQRLGKQIQHFSEGRSISESDNDQTYFNRLVKDKYAGIKVNVLPFEIFADGRWYKLSDQEKEDIDPLIVNNNWVSGNKLKIRRAKKFGHWFWKEKSGKCDKTLVNDTVYQVDEKDLNF